MTNKRFINDINNGQLIDTKGELSTIDYSDTVDFYELWEFLNKLNDENEQLKSDLKDCRKLKTKRLNKIRNHRAVIEDLGGSIRAYKGKIEQTNEKIDKIKEAMEDTGALTKRQLEEILND